MRKLVLLAEVLFAGKGCPICGGNKTEKARTCRACFEQIGADATKAVEEVIESCAKAAEGNAVAAKGAFKRGIVFGPVLAQVKIDEDAIFHIAQNRIGGHWDCSKSIPGGFVSVYVFGMTGEKHERGETITAMVELKNKEHRPGDVIHYCRGQVVAGVQSDVKLLIVRQEDSESLISSLPSELIEEGREKWRKYAVGFQYVDKNARLVNQDPLVDQLVDAAMKPATAACAG